MTRPSRPLAPSRRAVLRAAGGALIGLPALASLPGFAAPATPPRRFVALFFPNGTTMRRDWALSAGSSGVTLGSAHASLVPLASKLSLFRELNGDYGGAPDHSRGTASFLTGAPISNRDTPEVAQSIDQAIAEALDPPTPIRSLHLGPTPYPAGPPSDTGWPSGYNTYLSWRSPTAPNPPLESAQVAFDQLFGAGDSPEAERRLRLRQSILDHTIGQVAAIEPRLGTEDRRKLDEYLTSVREVESGLQHAAPEACVEDPRPEAGLSFPDHTEAMLGVLVKLRAAVRPQVYEEEQVEDDPLLICDAHPKVIARVCKGVAESGCWAQLRADFEAVLEDPRAATKAIKARGE